MPRGFSVPIKPGASRRSLALGRVVGAAAAPGLIGGVISLLALIVLLLYITQWVQPELDDLRDADTAARSAHDAMLNQETGVRGYLASGDDVFLQPYEEGRHDLAGADAALVTSLNGRSALLSDAVAVLEAEHRWQDTWTVPAVDGAWRNQGDGQQSGRIDTAELSAFLERGKKLFDAYRAKDTTLQASISAELDATRRRRDVSLLAGALVLALVGLGSLGLLVRAQRRLRHQVVRPVLELTEVVTRVTEGDLQVAVRPDTPVKELADLGTGLTAMTGTLADRAQEAEDREAELVRHGERLEQVLQLSRDLTESLSLRYTAQRLIGAVSQLSGAAQVELWLQSEDQKELVRFAGTDAEPADAPNAVDVGVGAVGRAARYGRAIPLDQEGPAGNDTSVGLAIPMVVGARVVSVLAVRAKSGVPLDLDLVEGLLLQGASAIHAAQLHGEVEEQSRRDALTGLGNRRQFDADLEAEVERASRYRRSLALVMLDLDHFKRINDVYGHQRGDEVLQDVAGQLSTDLRDIDMTYRYGGEELCILMPECTAEDAAAAAERLLERIARSFPWATRSPVTVSAGVAELGDGDSAARLVGNADQALYAAKRNGRNRVELANRSG